MEVFQERGGKYVRIQLYNYRSGQQIIPEEIRTFVIRSIEEYDYYNGRIDIRSFNKDLLDKLRSKGWADGFPLSVYSKISITSVLDKIGICVQTGNVARIYADILKMQTLFTDEKLSAGILVVPTKEYADSLGKNVANYERLIRELTYVFSKVITIPLLIISFGSD